MFGTGHTKSGPSRNSKAIVTGAGSGIGRAIAIELAERGGDVICADIDLARAQETARIIGRLHSTAAHAFQCDVSSRADVENLALHSELMFGGPASLIVNNAGVGIGGKPVGEIGFDDWTWALGINLWGVIHGCEIFTPQLRAARAGGIINVASAAGFAAAPSMGAYNVSIAGVVSLSETMAAELSGTGVTVSVLCPTFVKTNVAVDGRITAESSKLAETLMRWTGFSPERVAQITLDAHDKGRLYILPQLDAHIVWRMKRLLPAQYAKGAGLLNRLLPQNNPAPSNSFNKLTGV